MDSPSPLVRQRQISGLQSLDNSLDILLLFTQTDRTSINIQFVTSHLGLPRSTAYRMVRALEAKGFLRKTTKRGQFSLGPQVFNLGQRTEALTDLSRIAKPILEELVLTTRETAFLTVKAGNHAQCIEYVNSKEEIRLSVSKGLRIDLHAGASAKIFLAYLSRNELERYLTKPLRAYTEHTTVDPATLRHEVEDIRLQGYAISKDQTGVGTVGVCVPVFSQTGRLLAGLNVAGPTYRLDEHSLIAQIPLLRHASRRITHVLSEENIIA